MILKKGTTMAMQVMLVVWLLVAGVAGKCLNSTEFKYDLKVVSELKGYHSMCSEFARRTCCSGNNFDTLAKRMSRVMGGNIGLSNACRYRLVNALCSPCDGDIGEGKKQGPCLKYCWQFYEDCKEDYFSFDNNQQFKVCKEDDIICSKLSHIVSENNREGICHLLELSVDKHNCWNGEVSANFKGVGKAKVNVVPKPRTRRRGPSVWEQLEEYALLLIPLVLALLVLGIYLARKMQQNRVLWKRQLRNL